MEAVGAFYFEPLEELEEVVAVGMKTLAEEAVVGMSIVVVDEGVELLEDHNYYGGECNFGDMKKEQPEQPHHHHHHHHSH